MTGSISRRDLPLMRVANKCGDGDAVCDVVECERPADYMAAPIGSRSTDTWVNVCMKHARRIPSPAEQLQQPDTLPRAEIERAAWRLQQSGLVPYKRHGRPCYRCPGDGQM